MLTDSRIWKLDHRFESFANVLLFHFQGLEMNESFLIGEIHELEQRVWLRNILILNQIIDKFLLFN